MSFSFTRQKYSILSMPKGLPANGQLTCARYAGCAMDESVARSARFLRRAVEEWRQ